MQSKGSEDLEESWRKFRRAFGLKQEAVPLGESGPGIKSQGNQRLGGVMSGFIGGFVVFGLICAIFWGWSGFFWGGLVGGVFSALGAKKETRRSGAVLINKPSGATKPVVVSRPVTSVFDSSQKQDEVSLGTDLGYVKLVASCIGVATVEEGSLSQEAMGLMREIVAHDSLISDKDGLIAMASEEFEAFRLARAGTGVGFDLKLSDVKAGIRRISAREQIEHLAIILRSLRGYVAAKSAAGAGVEVVQALIGCLPAAGSVDYSEGDRKFAQRKILAQYTERENLAEEILRRSGDLRASSAFHAAKSQKRFGREFINMSRGSTVLRTAMGVFLGLVAADVVRAAIQSEDVGSLSKLIDKKIEEVGGVESFGGLGEKSFEAVEGGSGATPSVEREAAELSNVCGVDDDGYHSQDFEGDERSSTQLSGDGGQDDGVFSNVDGASEQNFDSAEINVSNEVDDGFDIDFDD